MKEYGERIGHAVMAVRQMHSDVSRLLQDCDGTIGKGKPSLFGNSVTRELTYQLRATEWMAQGVYRYWDASEELPGLVVAVTVAFFFSQPNLPKEPVLILGQLKYAVETDGSAKGICKEWDLWEAFSRLPQEHRKLGVVLSAAYENPSHVEWAKLTAVPLYEIASMNDVQALLERVRQAHP